MSEPHFRVRLWCRDCTGEDNKGCFDGGTELLSDTQPPFCVRTFDTLHAAVDAGYEATRDCGPWEFDVLDLNDDEVEYDTMTEAEIDAYVHPPIADT